MQNYDPSAKTIGVFKVNSQHYEVAKKICSNFKGVFEQCQKDMGEYTSLSDPGDFLVQLAKARSRLCLRQYEGLCSSSKRIPFPGRTEKPLTKKDLRDLKDYWERRKEINP